MLRRVANGSTEPKHVQTGAAERESGHDVDAPQPAMKDGEAVANLRNQLQHSRKDDDRGREHVHADDKIAKRLTGRVAVSHEFIPRLPVPARGRNDRRKKRRRRKRSIDR